MVIYIIIGIVVVIFIYTLATYNSLIKANNIVKEAFSTMDVYLKKRWDLVPNLVETVKGYMKHEKDTLNELTSLRASNYEGMSIEGKIESDKKINKEISKIIAVAENYPDLKANQNFIQLTTELSKIEDDIANSRKYYNGAVRILNNKIQMFPSNIIAGIFGFKSMDMFETKEEERNNVKVELE